MKTVRIYPSSLELASDESKDAAFVPQLIEALSKVGAQSSYVAGDFPYVTVDRLIIGASADSLSYPAAIAESLYDKSKLSQTLAPHGFTVLETQLITDPDAITLTNFIVKLKEGSGSSLHGFNRFAAVAFADKGVFKRHPLFDMFFQPGQYIAQQTVGNPRDHYTVSVTGTVNANGDVYFVRSSKDHWVNGKRVTAELSYSGYDAQKQLIANFIKASGIKHAAFMLQFLIDGENLYAIDWNFRLGVNIPRQMIDRNLIEYETAIAHMVGDQPTESLRITEDWVTHF